MRYTCILDRYVYALKRTCNAKNALGQNFTFAPVLEIYRGQLSVSPLPLESAPVAEREWFHSSVCVKCCSAVFYVVAQSLGAVVGAAVLKAVSLSGTNDALGTPVPAAGVTQAQAFIIELIITFVLVLTVFAACDSLRSGISGSGPLAIGLSISMCHLWAVRYRRLYAIAFVYHSQCR